MNLKSILFDRQSFNLAPLPTRGRTRPAVELLPVEADATVDQVSAAAQRSGRKFKRCLRKTGIGKKLFLDKIHR